jgi:hypothetical protein
MDGVPFFKIIEKEIVSDEERIELYKRILFLLLGKKEDSLINFDTDILFLEAIRCNISPGKQNPILRLLFESLKCCRLKITKNQTTAMSLQEIKRNGNTLQFVQEQNEEICLSAVLENDNSFKYVKEKTPEICLTIAKKRASHSPAYALFEDLVKASK